MLTDYHSRLDFKMTFSKQISVGEKHYSTLNIALFWGSGAELRGVLIFM